MWFRELYSSGGDDLCYESSFSRGKRFRRRSPDYLNGLRAGSRNKQNRTEQNKTKQWPPCLCCDLDCGEQTLCVHQVRAEAVEDVYTSRKKQHQTMMHYFCSLNTLQYKKKMALLEPLLGYMQAQVRAHSHTRTHSHTVSFTQKWPIGSLELLSTSQNTGNDRGLLLVKAGIQPAAAISQKPSLLLDSPTDRTLNATVLKITCEPTCDDFITGL